MKSSKSGEAKEAPTQKSSCCSAPVNVMVDELRGDDGKLRRVAIVKCTQCFEKCDGVWK